MNLLKQLFTNQENKQEQLKIRHKNLKKELEIIEEIQFEVTESNSCIICVENAVSLIFLPCRHALYCSKYYKDKKFVCSCCNKIIEEVEFVTNIEQGYHPDFISATEKQKQEKEKGEQYAEEIMMPVITGLVEGFVLL